MTNHAIQWFEIPVTDLDRATAFYEAIFSLTLERMELGTPVAVFPADEDGVGGALSLDDREPSDQGSLVYLTAPNGLQTALDRVPGAGGEVLLPRTDIGDDYGYYAYIKDTEGNKVGLFENA